jgi:hypothetical protein
MFTTAMRVALVALAVWPAMAEKEPAPDLLAKALQAYTTNHAQQDYWNWNTVQSRRVVGKDGRELQGLPEVTVESVIRKDGRRCNAVVQWGDGVEPHMLAGDADSRCSGLDPAEVPFQLEALLKSTRVKLVKGPGLAISIQPDKSRRYDPVAAVRCTASIRATVRLDSVTYYPVHIEGEVVDSGCEATGSQEVRYGGEPFRAPLRQMLHKGTTFVLDCALQKDKFGNSGRSYWILAEQHWSRPFQKSAQALLLMNRRFAIDPAPDRRLLEDARTSAQEFGAESSTRFDIPKEK